MSVSKEQPGQEKAYSDEDQKIIISLLGEYSEKLLAMCARIEKNKGRDSLIRAVSVVVPATILALTSFLIKVLPNRFFVAATSSYVASIIVLLFLMPFIYDYNKSAAEEKALLMHHAEILSIKLEKVIRVASQVHEHVVRNFVGRLELDLRLTDAEAALQCYKVPKIHNGKIL
jgi:hypothetical protein